MQTGVRAKLKTKKKKLKLKTDEAGDQWGYCFALAPDLRPASMLKKLQVRDVIGWLDTTAPNATTDTYLALATFSPPLAWNWPLRTNSRLCWGSLLVKPHFNLNSYGKRAFSVAAPELWNNLPEDIKSANSIDDFKRKLKTFLFTRAYESWCCNC